MRDFGIDVQSDGLSLRKIDDKNNLQVVNRIYDSRVLSKNFFALYAAIQKQGLKLASIKISFFFYTDA